MTVSAPQLRVWEYMVPDPATLTPETRLVDALLTMRSRSIRHLLVVNDGKLVGLLSERDIFRYAPSVRYCSEEEYNRVFEHTPVGEVMISDVTTVTPETTMTEAVGLLHANKFGCLPVVEEGRVVGILTVTDVLRFTYELLGLGLQKATSQRV